jgi:hypothetical protein
VTAPLSQSGTVGPKIAVAPVGAAEVQVGLCVCVCVCVCVCARLC